MPHHRKTNPLKKLIEKQINQTHRHWTGRGIGIRRNSFKTSVYQRQRVQDIGRIHGCHTCRTKVETDSNQPWIGDHIPPTNLSATAKRVQNCSTSTYLFPSCHECSHRQAQLVKELRGNPHKVLSQDERKLIHGGRPSNRGFRTYGTKVSLTEGLRIQALGETEGCHICGTMIPVSLYISDHTFPQEFCTNYMEQVFEDLEIDYPTGFELRPQCTRCSLQQGGKVLQIRMRAVQYARSIGITVYKE